MRGRRSIFGNRVCEFLGRRSVSLICKRCKPNVSGDRACRSALALRRGFAELKTNSHGAAARALRRARSSQRVRRAQHKFARRHSQSASTRTISAEGSPTNSHGATARSTHKFARRHSQSASTRTISADSRQIRTAPQPERFDTHDLRRGFAELKTNSHGATARALRTHDLRRGFAKLKTNSHGATAKALRRARSPQRVRRAQDNFARRHSQSASTRTISAEGSPSARQIRTAPQIVRVEALSLWRRANLS